MIGLSMMGVPYFQQLVEVKLPYSGSGKSGTNVTKMASTWQKGHQCGKRGRGINVAKVAPMWWARALWQEKINHKWAYISIIIQQTTHKIICSWMVIFWGWFDSKIVIKDLKVIKSNTYKTDHLQNAHAIGDPKLVLWDLVGNDSILNLQKACFY